MVFLFLEDNILPTYNDNEKRQLFLDENYKAGGLCVHDCSNKIN